MPTAEFVYVLCFIGTPIGASDRLDKAKAHLDGAEWIQDGEYQWRCTSSEHTITYIKVTRYADR